MKHLFVLLDWTGLGLLVFGLGLITVVWSWSRSRTLWSQSWLWSHYVLVALTMSLSPPGELKNVKRLFSAQNRTSLEERLLKSFFM